MNVNVNISNEEKQQSVPVSALGFITGEEAIAGTIGAIESRVENLENTCASKAYVDEAVKNAGGGGVSGDFVPRSEVSRFSEPNTIVQRNEFGDIEANWLDAKVATVEQINVSDYINDDDEGVAWSLKMSDNDADKHFASTEWVEEYVGKNAGGGSEGGYTAMPVVEHESDETRATIEPNKFHQWSGSLSSLTIELGTPTSGVVNQYVFQFAGYSGTTLSLPSSVYWENNEPPVIDDNYLYQVSIINNLATYVKYKYL